MSEFHRQPSKVWWESDAYSNPFCRPHTHRTQSSSPGSQDSGFSDTETSPTNTNHKATAPPKSNVNISVNNNVTTIQVTSRDDINQQALSNQVKTDVNDNNLLENVREKFTPTKSNLRQLFEDRYKNGGPGPGAKSVSPKGVGYITSTPIRRPINNNIYTEPVTHIHRYNKRNTNKVNRNLFKSIQHLECDEKHSNQYAINTTTEEHLTHNNAIEENTKYDDKSNYSITQIPEETQSLPSIDSSCLLDPEETEPANLTAPAILPEVQVRISPSDIELCQNDEEIGVTVKNANSDCDSEIEEIFPAHTSTPKHGPAAIMKKDRLRRKFHNDKLLLKYKDERVPPIVFNINDYNDSALNAWYFDLNDEYEPECMTVLQSKSLTGELTERVTKLAVEKTELLREIIQDAIAVYTEIDNLNGQPILQPLCSTLSIYIRSYLKKHPPPPPYSPTALQRHCMELSTLKSTPTTSYIDQLTLDFSTVHNTMLTAQVRKYLRAELTSPLSELDVRAAVTGLTSVCLHYAEGCSKRGVDLTGAFVDGGLQSSSEDVMEDVMERGAVELLVGLCEICEGSSLRRAILRALATVCSNGAAVNRFETSGGVDKAIVDVITDDALPEVERIEAIALLAQITAPWIDPPCSLPSIRPHLRPLIRSMTIFAHMNTCKENLLLCTAALANLTTLYVECVRHIVTFQTVDVLLKRLKEDQISESSCASNASSIEVYILEQVAIVVANVSATEEGRAYLTATSITPSALVCFLQTKPYNCDEINHKNPLASDFQTEDTPALNHPYDVAVVQRLQQKAIIALSRLCSNPKAAHHVVKMGGVRRLVSLCREKGERYGNDAVLVAALATLRKISETCGAAIMTVQDTQELVEPRLLDSFLAYSAQNESLV